MIKNILQWSFKILVGEVEKEFHFHLDNDSPIEAIEQVGIQILKHCGNIRDQVKAQQEAKPEDKIENLPEGE